MDIGSVLKELRHTQRWEQADLARQLGTTQQSVSKWESGTLPRAGALKRINDLLRAKGMQPVSVSTVIGQSTPATATTSAPMLLIVHTQNDCNRLIRLAQDKGMSVFITKKVDEAAKIIELVG